MQMKLFDDVACLGMRKVGPVGESLLQICCNGASGVCAYLAIRESENSDTLGMREVQVMEVIRKV